MSTPYDPNAGQRPAADPAAPTQFVPAAGQVSPTMPMPQQGQGQQGGFAPPAPGPADAAPAGFGAPPAFAAPEAGPAAPQYGQAPQFGQPPQGQPGAPAWGQQNATQPMPGNYPDPNGAYPNAGGYPNPGGFPNGGYPNAGYGVPVKPGKAGRGGGAAAFFLRSRLGRVVIGLVVVGGIAAYHYATADPAQRNSNGQVSQSGSMQATDLQVGDCFDAPSGTSNITSIKAIPCSQAHDSQVYAEPAITETSYPGDATLQAEAKTDCGSDSAQASVSQDAPSSLEIDYYVPQDETTFEAQDYVICALNDSTPDLTQSYVSGASAAS